MKELRPTGGTVFPTSRFVKQSVVGTRCSGEGSGAAGYGWGDGSGAGGAGNGNSGMGFGSGRMQRQGYTTSCAGLDAGYSKYYDGSEGL